jgi:FKBP-type peptidyl-prolyl cis-trans isomerase
MLASAARRASSAAARRALCTVATPSGLRYRDLHEPAADARRAAAGELVSIHYTGRLSDGAVFDTSLAAAVDRLEFGAHAGDDLKGWDRGIPVQFTLGGGEVIAGWDEGVEGMRVGGRRELVVPPALGYGEEGAGDKIPPGATLTFEVELLDVGYTPASPTAGGGSLWSRIFG